MIKDGDIVSIFLRNRVLRSRQKYPLANSRVELFGRLATVGRWLVVNHKHDGYTIKHSLNFSQCNKYHSAIRRQNRKKETRINIHHWFCKNSVYSH